MPPKGEEASSLCPLKTAPPVVFSAADVISRPQSSNKSYSLLPENSERCSYSCLKFVKLVINFSRIRSMPSLLNS
jgi:hypothetical protein